MSLNHIIDANNPYTYDEEGLLNLNVGSIKCEYLQNVNLDIGRQSGGTTITASDPSIIASIDGAGFYWAKGQVAPLNDYTYTLKLNITISAPIAFHRFYIDVENTKITHVGNFDALQYGQLCSESAIPALLACKTENNGNFNVRLHFHTADGSNLVAGSYSGNVVFVI